MKCMIVFVIVVASLSSVLADGVSASGRVAIHSCEADAAARHQCVAQHTHSIFDTDKIQDCIKGCAPIVGKNAKSGEWATGGEHDFFKCVHEQRIACLKTTAAATVQLVDAPAPVGTGVGGRRRGWWEKRGGGPANENIIDGILRHATDCNVKDCVTAALGPDLLKDSAAGSEKIEKAMCLARAACPPSAQCTTDRDAVRAAECKCKSNEPQFETTCKAKFPDAPSNPAQSPFGKVDPCAPPPPPKPCQA